MPGTDGNELMLYQGRLRISGSFFGSLVDGASTRASLIDALERDIAAIISTDRHRVRVTSVAVGSLIAEYAVSAEAVAFDADTAVAVASATAAIDAAGASSAAVAASMPLTAALYANVSAAAAAEPLTLASATVTYNGAAAVATARAGGPSSGGATGDDAGCGGVSCGIAVGIPAALCLVALVVAGFILVKRRQERRRQEAAIDDAVEGGAGVLDSPFLYGGVRGGSNTQADFAETSPAAHGPSPAAHTTAATASDAGDDDNQAAILAEIDEMMSGGGAHAVDGFVSFPASPSGPPALEQPLRAASDSDADDLVLGGGDERSHRADML
jgi:hypothetical protein